MTRDPIHFRMPLGENACGHLGYELWTRSRAHVSCLPCAQRALPLPQEQAIRAEMDLTRNTELPECGE